MLQNERFERFLNGLSRKTAQKPLKILLQNERFERFLNGLSRKTAQKRLKSCLRNRSKITARNELFLSGFCRQLRSKSCFKMSGLSGFWTTYLEIPLKNRSKLAWETIQKSPQEMSGFWAVFFRQLRSKPCFKMSGLSCFWTFYLEKPLKNRSNLAWETVQKSPQEISGFWAVFFRQLRSKPCFKMSGLSGFWTTYLEIPLKNRSKLAWETIQKSPQEMSGFWAVFLDNYAQNFASKWAVWAVFERFI